MIQPQRTTGPRLSSPAEQREEVELWKTLCERITAARRLSGVPQLEAAEAMGYANSSHLIKAGTLLSGPWYIRVRPASVGQGGDLVRRVDRHLLWLSDSYENDPESLLQTFVARSVLDEWQRQRQEDMAVILRLCHEVQVVSAALREIVTSKGEFQAALTAFVRHNSDFEDMKAGAKLLRTAAALATATERAASKMHALVERRVKTENPLIRQALNSGWCHG